MDYLTPISIIALAALIHASFQLGVSMVTLLSSHAIGRKTAGRRTLHLVRSFLWGTIVMTTLIVSSIAFVATVIFRGVAPSLAWSIVAGMMVAVGIAVWLFYYRRGDGTMLWLPRPFVSFLTKRITKTKLGAEAFSLGLAGVIGELIFIIAPVTAAAFALLSLPTTLQLAGVALYVVVSSLGMIIVTIMIGSGHNLGRIQRWRETNKRFLQFAAGSGLLVLGFYLYVDYVITPSMMLAGVH